MKLERALAYIEQGWSVFPLVPNTKVPLTKSGFKDATKSAYAVRRWWSDNPEANIGIATGEVSGVAVVDVDVKNGAQGRESLSSLKGMPPTLTVRTPSGGWHLYYLPPGPLRCKNGLLPGIDIKADGGYVVAPGSIIDGEPYEWIDPEMDISAMPGIVLDLMSKSNGNGAGPAPAIPPGTPVAEGQRNATLASMAGTMRRRGMVAGEMIPALKAFNANRCSPPLPDEEVEAIANSISRYPTADDTAPAEGQPEDEEPRPPGFTDDALALAFTDKHSEDWRYVAGWGQWLVWEGPRWVKEATLKSFDNARLICREAAARCMKPKIAAKVASASTVAAVERLARADRRHAATTEQWDTDPWLFNTQVGVVNLKVSEEAT